MQLVWFKDVHGEEAIKAKRKELAKEHHPDKHHEKNKLLATKKFQQIEAEFTWLSKNGWNILAKEEVNNSQWEVKFDWSGFNSRVSDDVEWSNPFGNPKDNPFYKGFGSNPNYYSNPNEEFNKKQYESFKDFFNGGKTKESVKDEELEETIQLVNEASNEFNIAKIKDRKQKQKAIIYCIIYNWLIKSKSIKEKDFERLAIAMGYKIGEAASIMANQWWIQFNNIL